MTNPRSGALARWTAAGLLLAGIAPGAPETARATPDPASEATFSVSRRLDPDGLSLLRKTRRRSPTGFLYPYPFDPPAGLELWPGWTARVFASLGWTESFDGGGEAYYREYADRDDDIADAIRLDGRHPSGTYGELGATSIGRSDASAFAEGGFRGLLRVRGYYDQLQHRYAEDARVLFAGAGSEHLTLPPGLVPGNNTEAQIDAALTATPEHRVAITRKKGGVDVRMDPHPSLALHAGYQHEQRRGERPFGGAIQFAFRSPSFGSVVETLEPIDARTHDFRGGLSFARSWLQFELDYEGSVFDTRRESLTWDNPFAGTGVDQGRFALAPDNDAHRFNGTLGFTLPARGRWTTTLGWATARQDATLLAPTINPAFLDWTDPATSLSRRTADARVDTTHGTSTLRLSPLRSLSLGAAVRFRKRDNQTSYNAYNPAIDEYGYVVEDGSFGVGRRFAAAPFEEERWSGEGSATWSPLSRTRFSLEAEHERVNRDQRARRLTRENRGRVSVSTRAMPGATLRVAYEIADRTGSSFDRGRDASYYSAGPPDFASAPLGTPQRSLLGFEQWDLADRVRQAATARINYLLADVADLAFAGGLRDDDYGARYGLRKAHAADANIELSVQPSPAFDAHAYGGVEWRRRRLDGIDSTASTGSDLAPGGVLFPFDGAWTARSKAQTFAAGAGFSARPWSRLELRADYQLLLSRERIAYDFASAAALAPGLSAADVGNHFPQLRNTDHVVETTARITVTDWLATRVIYRFQHSRVSNFHQAGLQPRIGHALYLGHIDGDFNAHVVGASAEVSF